MARTIKRIYVIAYPEPSKKTDFEVRVLSTRIVLAILGALSFMDAFHTLYEIETNIFDHGSI